jgi:cysteine desulfurase
MQKEIYLDNSTTTKPSQEALNRMIPFLTDFWGSATAPHQKGQELLSPIQESLKEVYSLLGGKESDRLVFTSSGAESVNHLVFSVYHEITRVSGKNHFITSAIDEAAVMMSCHRLEESGCVIKTVSVDKQGRLTAQAVAEAITPRTALVSLSWANGLTGVIHPVSEIAKICQARGVLFHLDATHVLGKLFFDLEEIGAQIITFNGNHLHAPKGTGGIYVKEGVPFTPYILGGNEQGGYRAGCLNVAGLVALGVAAREAAQNRNLLCTEVARLRNQLENGIVERYPEALPLFQKEERLPHCTTILFPGIVNEAMLYALNRKNLFASIGGGESQQISIIVKAAGIEEALAQSAVSFSLSRYTTEDQIDRAIEVIGDTAQALRKMSRRFNI